MTYRKRFAVNKCILVFTWSGGESELVSEPKDSVHVLQELHAAGHLGLETASFVVGLKMHLLEDIRGPTTWFDYTFLSMTCTIKRSSHGVGKTYSTIKSDISRWAYIVFNY